MIRHVFRLATKEPRMLKPGDPAPDFDTTDQVGRPLRLHDMRGKKVVLWFFPKADTPG
jgi:peroxiredoxin Q/BCP